MTIKEMENLGMMCEIPTLDDAEHFISMVRFVPVTGDRTYEEFCEFVKYDFIQEVVNYAQKFGTRLLYTQVEKALNCESGIGISYDYYKRISYWRRMHNIHLDKIPNRVFKICGKKYTLDSELTMIVEVI